MISYNYGINIDDDNKDQKDKNNSPNENNTVVCRERRKFPILYCDYEDSDPHLGTELESNKMCTSFNRLLEMLNSAFPTGELPDLYPNEKENQLEFWIDWLQNNFLRSIYHCGLAQTQQQYDDAIEEVTNCFDLLKTNWKCEAILFLKI